MAYEYVISSVLAFIVAFSATPVAKKLAFRVGAVDVPNDARRIHNKPIPRLGGLAIVAGFVVSLLYNIFFSLFDEYSVFAPNTKLIGFFIALIIIVTMGIIDDIYQLKARYKLIFQTIAALVIAFSGTRIVNVTNPFSDSGMSTLNIYISFIVTVLWVIGITNAINLIDGLDGLAVGVTSIASLSLFIVSVIEGDVYSAIFTAILVGATLGFLPFNFNPAKIFMSDTGANFLGLALAFISIQGTLKSYATISIAIPLLVLGLPIFDTIFAIVRRIADHQSVMNPDRGHLHHRLIDMGLSHRNSVIVMYIVSAALGLCAIVLANKGALPAIIIIIIVAVFIVGGARYMINTNDDNTEEEYDEDDDEEN